MSTVTIRGNTVLPSVLFVVFLILKLCHVIDWSWWWVTAPLWGPLAFAAALVVVVAVVRRR